MQHLPLYFDFRAFVEGRGFVAAVHIRGRATGSSDFGSYWIYGVNPGGLAEHGEELKSAYAAFRTALTGVLFDFAEEAADFSEFRREVEIFLAETDDDSVAEWIEARRAIREGAAPPDLDLRRETEDLEPDLTIRNLLDPASAQTLPINVLRADQELLAA